MTAPSSAPGGERGGSRPGLFEVELLFTGEHLVSDEDQEQPGATRATRRAARRSSGPPCGNNPRFELSDGDRQVVEEFLTYLAHRNATTKETDPE